MWEGSQAQKRADKDQKHEERAFHVKDEMQKTGQSRSWKLGSTKKNPLCVSELPRPNVYQERKEGDRGSNYV
jgi:hypothetical protein